MEDLCQKLICHLCLKDEHRNHEFEEAQEIMKEKHKNFIEHVNSLTKSLLSNKEKLLMAKEDAKKDTMEFTEKITRAKDEQIATVLRMMTYLYNTMIEEFMDNFADISTKVDNKTREIDDNLGRISRYQGELQNIRNISGRYCGNEDKGQYVGKKHYVCWRGKMSKLCITMNLNHFLAVILTNLLVSWNR